MSLKDGIISAPVSIDDVKSVLGESSNDLATLCKSGNVNAFQSTSQFPTTSCSQMRMNMCKGRTTIMV